MTYDTLISVTTLATAQRMTQRTWLVCDVRFDLEHPEAGRAAYAAAHLPGAVYLHLDEDLSGPKTGRNGRHPLPAAEAFVARMAALGVDDDTQIVLYDASGGMFAARAWWLLRWVGHQAAAVLDGGLPAWVAGGQPLSSAPAGPQAVGQFSHRPSLVSHIDHATLRAGLAHYTVVDARASDRFRGENETLDPVGGHIPGALNRCFKDNLQADGRFKPAEALRAEWQALLGPVNAALVHQCGSGVTACHNLVALQAAGLPAGTLYPGSWSEWCAQPGAPMAQGA